MLSKSCLILLLNFLLSLEKDVLLLLLDARTTSIYDKNPTLNFSKLLQPLFTALKGWIGQILCGKTNNIRLFNDNKKRISILK